MTLLLWSLVCWLVTLIIVEGAIFDEPRDWIKANAPKKIAYLVGCHLCTGIWVAALVVGVSGIRPLGHGPVGFVGAVLATKAIAHLVLLVFHIGEALISRLDSWLSQ